MNKKLILTIDDDEDFNRLIDRILTKNGFEVITCTKASDFLRKLHHLQPSLCLIDLNLNEAFGAGFQLIEAIRKAKGNKTPLFICSFRSDKKDIARAIQLGANDYIHKPLDSLVLLDKINQYVEVKDPFEPLPYFEVTESKRKSNVLIDQKIISINEFGITIEGPYLISRKSLVKIKSKLISKILESPEQILQMTVNESWLEPDRHVYRSFLEFNSENQDLLNAIRKWLVSNSKI